MGGAGEGTTPFAAQRRATRSLGFALPLRSSPVAGEPGLASPSRRLSAAHACGSPARPARPGTGCGSGAAGSPLRNLGFRGCSPVARRGPAPLAARGPAGNDSRRVPYPRQRPRSPDPAGRADRPRGPPAPGPPPTWRRFQLGLYLRSREGERDKPGKRCGQAGHGQQPRAPRLRWGAGFGAFLDFQGGIFSFFLGQRLPRAGHTSGNGLAPRVPLASALEQLAPAAARFPPAPRRYRPEVP